MIRMSLDLPFVEQSLQQLHDLNCNRDLVTFRRYEIKTSLSYLNATPFFEDSFFHIGPGAVNMCQLIFGVIPTTLDEMEHLKMIVKRRLLDSNFPFAAWPTGAKWSNRNPQKFTVRQLEDCLCEYRKFLRACDYHQRGEALPLKYRYVPHSRPHTA